MGRDKGQRMRKNKIVGKHRANDVCGQGSEGEQMW